MRSLIHMSAPYAAAIRNDFILMDDNARPHRARIVEGIWRITVWNEWNGQLDLRPEPIEFIFLRLSWQRVAALNPQGRYMS
ncbi:hypothetical protein TNCV_3519751 [Trichonephila clavipes]|nr:hypothetical protein TNCV_3519751 [Trichonephila clavipes]